MNTNIKIKQYETKKQFKNRANHDNRLTNSSEYKYHKDKYINIVEKTENFNYDITTNSDLTRTEISRKLTSCISRLNKYEKELEVLDNTILKMVNTENFNPNNKYYIKTNNKYNKKSQTIDRLTTEINTLTTLKNNTIDKRTITANEKPYVEITFGLTRANSILRDKTIGEDWLQLVKEFIADKFNGDTHSFSVHLDQTSPHVHLLMKYDIGTSLNKDLTNLYPQHTSNTYRLSQLQQDFNNFTREHELIKKRELTISKITKGKVYIDDLALYKKEDEKYKNTLDNNLNRLKQKSFENTMFGEPKLNKDSYINDLEKNIKKISVENNSNKHIRTSIVNESEDLKSENIKVKEEAIILNKDLQNENTELNNKFKTNSTKLASRNIEISNLKKTIKDSENYNKDHVKAVVEEQVAFMEMKYNLEIKDKDTTIEDLEKYKQYIKDNPDIEAKFIEDNKPKNNNIHRYR